MTTKINKKPRATASAVRSLRPFGWADFKHKLVAIGVLASPDDDVPTEWIAAFKKAFGL